MNALSDLIHTSTGIALDSAAALLTSQQEPDLGSQRTAERGLGTGIDSTLIASAGKAGTVPPEIIQLIVNYLDNRDLTKVLTLNWTWAQIVAPKIWQEVHFTAKASRIVFLITRSVLPLPEGAMEQSIAVAGENSANSVAPNTTRMVGANNGITGLSPTLDQTTEVQKDRPMPAARRNSYPWPTLLPYHSMIHSLHVSLSSIDMIRDLLEIIPCCSELRSFSIQSAIPTGDLLIQGAIASSCNDVDIMEPPGDGNNLSSVPAPLMHTSASSASSPASRHQHSHSHSVHINPYNRLPNARAGLQDADEETVMASTTLQSSRLLTLLANSCPKLEKLWFSGFHPVSVLGAPTDLRPRLPKFDVKGFNEQRQQGVSDHRQWEERKEAGSMGVEPPVAAETVLGGGASSLNATTSAQLPPTFYVSNTAAPPIPAVTVTTVPPVPIKSYLTPQSKIHSLQFVDSTLSPQYLLAMIQHSLPHLKSLHLTQCWQGNPLQTGVLDSVGKICPGLKELTLHATQSHRTAVSSEDVLRLLKRLESVPKEEREEGATGRLGNDLGSLSGNSGAGALADFPSGAFTKSSYMTDAPSISSTAATVGSSTMSSSNSSSSSALVTLSSSASASSNSDINAAVGNNLQHSLQQLHRQQQSLSDAPEYPSALESISIWFPHSILDEAITAELANRKRHPKLKRVEFGSEDTFDVGEDYIRNLQMQRPELEVCTWVGYGDTGEDRED
ncbi:hypothetical protein EDD21DRAFT_373130 [Dissophora ornata]|nr:hypothetical protein BGZ58_003472 [Dissophora ornata]KAI8601951.1 hypothetical protein EDD21DRAFT_373130 [Dissophora ornata]